MGPDRLHEALDLSRRPPVEPALRCVLGGGIALGFAWGLRAAGGIDRRFGGTVAHDGARLDLAAWEVVTHTVTGPALLAVILLAVILVGGGGRGARMIGAQILGGLAVGLVKVLDPRVRPDGGDGSWPSGHTVSAVLLALGLAAAVPRSRRSARRLAVLLLSGWSIAVGVSRVALGRHWPTDVLAGVGVALLVHAASGVRSWGIVGRWLRVDVLRSAVVLGFLAWAVQQLADPFPETTPRAWALAFLAFSWLRLEAGREPQVPTVRTRAREIAGVASLAACCFLAALVGSGATELWTSDEARAVAATGVGSLLGDQLRALGGAALGAGSLAERWSAALGFGLGVPAVVGLAGALGLRGRWRLGAGLVFASALGPLAVAHLATDDALRLAELLWMMWAVASLGTTTSRRQRVALWLAAGVALLDLAASGVWWAPAAALLGGGAAAACRICPRRWIGSVSAMIAAVALGASVWRGAGPSPVWIALAFLPWWCGFLVGRGPEGGEANVPPRGLVVAAWAYACAVFGSAEPMLAVVATVPGLALAVTARLARVDRFENAAQSVARRPAVTVGWGVTGVGLAAAAVWFWVDPVAELPPAPPLAVALVLWLVGGGLVVARHAWGSCTWLALRGLAVVVIATGGILVASVWPFAMRGSMTRQVVHAAARFEVAREVLLVGVDPGPLSRYVAPVLVDAGRDGPSVVARLDAGGLGLLVDSRRLDGLRRAGLIAEPTVRFEGFVPHAWERQVWLWFAP